MPSYKCIAHIGKHEVPSSRNPARKYTVTFNREPDKLGNEVWCDCPAWRMQSGASHGEERNTCKHIDALFDDICGWEQSAHGGKPKLGNGDTLGCPECGGAVEEA